MTTKTSLEQTTNASCRKNIASANLGLDTRRPTKEGKFPVVIRVCANGKQWAVSLRVYCTKDEYKKAISDSGKISPKVKELREHLTAQRKKALEVIDGLKHITKESFNQAFYSETDLVLSNDLDIQNQFTIMINDLYEDEKIRSAEWYQAALKSFLSFRGNVDLTMVDEEYLKKYDSYMTKKGCSRSTIKMYMEAMRRIMNIAIRKQLLNRKYYPFGQGGYTIGRAVKSKKALMPNQVKILYECRTYNPTQKMAKDFWLLSYLCHGANNVDLMRLKWKDISNNRIVFERSKTSKTTKELKSIVVYIHPEIKRIIDTYGNDRKGPNDFVFPVLNDKAGEKEIVHAIRDWRRPINRCLNRMGKRLGFDFYLSLSLARHSFATALKLKGTPVAVISDMLGHSSVGTTEHYMGSIEDDLVKDLTKDLLDFGKTHLKAV